MSDTVWSGRAYDGGVSGTETWATPAEQAGWRLDKAVAARASVGARRKARTVVESGKVSVGGEECRDAGRPVAPGDVVSIDWNRPGTGGARRAPQPSLRVAGMPILHEDTWLLVVDKPAGLLTDAASRKQERERDTVTDRLRPYLQRQKRAPFAAHRIDRDTSGAVLFAKDEGTFERLRAQFHARTPERVYLAIVEGVPTPREGLWADWMAWDAERRVQRAVDEHTPGGVLAEAHYRVTAELPGGRSALEVRLVSGRRNQIRLHAMLRGIPLVGERLYVPPGRPRKSADIARHALHARSLAFDHPSTGARITIESPVPHDIRRLM